MQFTPILDEVNKELSCVCLRRSTTDVKDHSAFIREELNNKTEISVVEGLGMESFSAIRGGVHVVGSIYGTHVLRRALLWPYHPFYINTFYGAALLENRNTCR